MKKSVFSKKGYSSEEKHSMSMKPRQRMSQKMVFYIGGSLLLAFTLGLFIYFQFFKQEHGYAAASGDYRTAASGNWNSTSTWQKYNGTTWIAAVTTPTSADGAIEIQSGHTVTVTASVTVDQVTIDAGGQITVSTGTLTINKGTGTDITVNGTLDISSTVAFNSNASNTLAGTEILRSTGTITFASGSKININSNGILRNEGGSLPTTAGHILVNSGGTFQHAMDGGTIPSATWNSGSTCEITGANLTLPSGTSQSFQNFKWNCTSQTGNLNHGAALTTILGDFTLVSTGTGCIYIDQQGNNSTLNISGNLYVQGGTTYECVNGSATINITGNVVVTGGAFNFNQTGATAYGNTSTVMNVTGNVTVTGGTIDMSQSSAMNATKGWGIMNLSGNLNVSSPGIITESGNSKGQIFFAGSGGVIQTYSTNNQITNIIDYIINSGAIVRTNNNILTDAGAFTLSSGGGLMIGSANGITLTSALGNVQVTGTRSYSTGADYTYEGTAVQVSGDGLPSQVRNLTLNNSNNCTLTASTSASGTLTFTSGLWLATTDTLTLGTSTANLGTLSRVTGHVVGYFQRWIAAAATSNILFPVGTLSYYNGANFSFTVAPTAGSIVSTFILANPGWNGLPLTDAADVLSYVAYGYWSFGAMNSFAGGTYNVNLYCNGFSAVNDYTKLHILRRTGIGTSWAINGTHTAGTGSNAAPVANRTGMNTLGHFGVMSGSANPLPIELISFDAKLDGKVVKLFWKTASETNNNYFTIERSADGTDFTIITKVDGAGNSTNIRSYSAVDTDPLSGYSYYRLKQTDYDGKFTYSKIVSINNSDFESVSQEPIVIDESYPNPFSDHFTISYTLNDGDANLTFTIADMAGRAVATKVIPSKKGTNHFTYNGAGRIGAGRYIISLSDGIYTATKTIAK